MAKGYQVVVLGGSYWEDLLKLAPLGTSRRRYYDAKMREDSSTTDFDTAQELIDKTLSESKTLMWDMSLLADKRMRALNILDSSISPGAFAFQKGSEFQGIFEYHLMKIREAGILDRINLDYMPEPPLVIGTGEGIPLGYDNLIFPTIVLSFGGFGALIIMVLERVINFLAPKYFAPIE